MSTEKSLRDLRPTGSSERSATKVFLILNNLFLKNKLEIYSRYSWSVNTSFPTLSNSQKVNPACEVRPSLATRFAYATGSR